MPTLNVPQAGFLALPHKFRAFVAGYGSGKTWVGCASLMRSAWEWPRVPLGYFAPTYPHIRDIFFQTVEEVAADWGLRVKVRESVKEVDVYSGGILRTTIICRSMERPQDIVGFKIGSALVDEIDVLKPAKAATAWRKIAARMRETRAGLLNRIDVTTTPEGFGFAYRTFQRGPACDPKLAKLYGMVQASTTENAANLPKDYISSLRATYPANLIDAYIDGRFVNLTSGSVYPDFDRRLNHTSERIRPGETLHVGMDFNVGKMVAIVSTVRDDRPLTLAEVTKVRDTPQMCAKLRERWPEHAIVIYPDASGDSRSTRNANESDLSILRAAGFTVRAESANPPIRDRINAVNAQILTAAGERRWRINTDDCPTLTESLEQQAYGIDGEPDKAHDTDHAPDAVGYFIAQRWPIVRRVARISRLGVLA